MHQRTLLESAREILEGKVTIAPVSGYKKEVTPNEQKVLSTILNTLPKEYEVTNAKFFDSGNKGVSFKVDGQEYFIMYKGTRMGSDDLVRGTVELQVKGQPKAFFRLIGPDTLNKDFPSSSDYGKVARELHDMVSR
jgi:hypothetical protein